MYNEIAEKSKQLGPEINVIRVKEKNQIHNVGRKTKSES